MRSPARPCSTLNLVFATVLSTALPSLGLEDAGSASRRGLTVDDMLAMQRVSEHEVSPDGRTVVFTVRDTDLAANRGRTDVWIASTDGGWVRRLTTHPENDGSPKFTRDGKLVYFLSSRSGSSQVWKISPAGSEAEPVTRLPIDVNAFAVFPDGKKLLIAMDVYPDLRNLADTARRDEEQASNKVKARAYDNLLFRHWDAWEDGKFSHLFVWSPDAPDAPLELTPGQTTDSPTHPFGAMDEVSISPDGKNVAFVARVGGRDLAWTTNTDVFLTSADGKTRAVNLTAANSAYDFSPSFSPDGRSLAYLAMARAGYEADRQRVALIDMPTRKTRVLTEPWDRSASEISWSRDGRTIWTTADHLGHHALFAIDSGTGAVKLLVERGTVGGPQPMGDRILFARDSLNNPVELYSTRLDGSEIRPVTRLNAERVGRIAWGEHEQFEFKGAHGDMVRGFVMKPAHMVGGKVPVAMLIHGGPQGSFGDHFHYRWNPQAFAGRGYGVVFIDFHGSTGYGQAFTDAIHGDWGGAPYEDLMKGLDAALEKYPWLDGNRAVALGASYGGYMINWLNGHTDRFKALVCHDGNLDERMAYFDTEELWFPEWEHGGVPWEKPEGFLKHNPIDFVKNWKTPTLVIHGGNDFRVVDTQGMSTFTALQRKGIASRLLHFPDENHWVLKPLNSKRWYEEVLAWLDRWARK